MEADFFPLDQELLEIQNEQAKPLADCPEEPAAERMAMSSDGAMVPLVGGVWAEVKLVAIGVVARCKRKDEEAIVTSQLTYFARMAPAATFADQASAEVRRRGIERAKQVCALQDGAEWIQGFVDGHRHDAVRILDAGPCGWLRQRDCRQDARGGRASASQVG